MKIVAIVGPTASGKTRLAVELARRNNGVIISGDSMQIYRQMSISTAKPTADETRGVSYLLIDCLDVTESYSVARFCADAGIEAKDISAHGKLPIVCGGTGLYIDSFLHGVPFTEQEDVHPLRDRLNTEYDADDGMMLYRELAAADSVAAEKIHINNKVKLVRAVEIIRMGSTPSRQIELTQCTRSEYEPLYIGLRFADRALLYNRIEQRVDEMVTQGLELEAHKLYLIRDRLSPTSKNAIGCKELFEYFDGRCTFAEAIDTIKQSTRRYAKRQITWFGRNKDIHFIEASLPFDDIIYSADKILKDYINA